MQLFALVVIFVEVLTAGTLAISNPNSGFVKPVKTAVGKVLGISYLAQDTTEQPPSDQPSSSSDQPAPAPDQNSNNQPATQQQQQTQSQPDQTQQSQPNQQQVQTQPNQTQESQVQQDQSAPRDTTQNPNPSPDTANTSSQTVQTTNNTQQTQLNIQNSSSDQLKTDEQSLLSETPTPSSQNNDSAKSQTTALEQSANEAPQETPTPIPTPPQDLPQVDELTSPSQQALLNTDDVISTPQKVDESSQNEAKQEDKTLENLSPNQEAQKLLEFSKSKILDIDRNLKEDDFSTTSFLAQRLDNQLSQVSDALSKTTGTQNTNLRKQVSDFCKQASLAMQSQETFVPEDMEQDIQIARGQCMALE